MQIRSCKLFLLVNRNEMCILYHENCEEFQKEGLTFYFSILKNFFFYSVSILRWDMFCNILVIWSTIWQLEMLLLRSWRWWTPLDWDAKLAWCSQSFSHQIYLSGLEHSHRIHCFRLNWLWLLRFLQPKQNFFHHLVIVLVWLGLIWFYGISTIVGYLTPNPLYTYIFDFFF